MKLELKERDKRWIKALVACVILLVAACFFFALSIVYHEIVLTVVCGIGGVLFGTGTLLLINPNQLACMQVVKGEMTYKQLKAAVEAEDFERPIRFWQKDFRPGLFLVSQNWIVVEDHGNPVYVPKSKVRKIEMLMEPIEFGPELSGDGNTYMHYYNYFVFTCDEKHAYATGLISYDDTPEAKRVIQKHFPYMPFEVVREVKEWKQ